MLSEHLIVVTNDPIRPMRRVRVTAIIEETHTNLYIMYPILEKDSSQKASG